MLNSKMVPFNAKCISIYEFDSRSFSDKHVSWFKSNKNKCSVWKNFYCKLVINMYKLWKSKKYNVATKIVYIYKYKKTTCPFEATLSYNKILISTFEKLRVKNNLTTSNKIICRFKKFISALQAITHNYWY